MAHCTMSECSYHGATSRSSPGRKKIICLKITDYMYTQSFLIKNIFPLCVAKHHIIYWVEHY